MIFKNKSPKIFCIGAGKTGTTSVEKALLDLGYKLGNQANAELLLDDYLKRNFKAILNYCKSAEAFQDAPFCFQHTYQYLDQNFSNAKFILTVRDSDEQWYQSLINFHSKLFADGERVPTWEDLKNASYRYKGYAAEVRKKVYGILENEDPYDEQKLKNYYNTHNSSILDYFRYKSNFLLINVAKEDAYINLCEFINKKALYETFPWENKTSEL